jgi:hypothetical protein
MHNVGWVDKLDVLKFWVAGRMGPHLTLVVVQLPLCQAKAKPQVLGLVLMPNS